MSILVMYIHVTVFPSNINLSLHIITDKCIGCCMVVTGLYVAGYVSMSRACTGHVQQGVHNLLAALLLGCYSVKSKVVYTL